VVRVGRTAESGTGVVVREDGLVITNAHVVGSAGVVDVRLQDGRSFPSVVERTDTDADLALVHMPATGLATATLGDPSELRLGEPLIAIGYALDLPGGPSVTKGLYSASRMGKSVDWVQTDAALNPGNSGGPLLNLQGKVIGINTLRVLDDAGVSVQGLNFAISTTTVRAFMSGEPRSVAVALATAVVASPAQPARGPEEVVRGYYRSVDARDYAAAYRLMARNITDATDPIAFTAWFKDKHSIKLRSTSVDQQFDALTVVVKTAVQSDDTIGEAQQVAEYVDRWTLVLEAGEWRMSAVATTLATGVSTQTARELRTAVEEYDHLEEKAYAAEDPQLVSPRATANIIGRLKRSFDTGRGKGDHEVEKLERIVFRGFRVPSEGRAEVDAIETWSSVHYDLQGKVTSREPAKPLYMTMHFIRQGGIWLLDNTVFFNQNPF
jgi:hypothetical protein